MFIFMCVCVWSGSTRFEFSSFNNLILISTAGYVPAVALVGMCFVKCDKTLAIIVLCIAVGACGANYGGHISSLVDLAPRYSSIIMGIGNTLSTIPGFVSPIITGALTNENVSEFYIEWSFYWTLLLASLICRLNDNRLSPRGIIDGMYQNQTQLHVKNWYTCRAPRIIPSKCYIVPILNKWAYYCLLIYSFR